MKIYLTKEGRNKLEAEIARLHTDLEKIRAEKAIAYTASGDCWHDNPGFNALEQREKKIAENISENNKLLQIAELVDITERNVSRVRLGSIVKIERYFVETDESFEDVWEIVGYGESDPENRKIAYNAPLAVILLEMKRGEIKTVNHPRKGPVDYELLGLYASWEDYKSKEE